VEPSADDGDGGVLFVQIGGSAFLNRSGDFAHALVARGLRQYPLDRPAAVEQREYAARKCKHESCIHNASPRERPSATVTPSVFFENPEL